MIRTISSPFNLGRGRINGSRNPWRYPRAAREGSAGDENAHQETAYWICFAMQV
jgi:hypothetical protein